MLERCFEKFTLIYFWVGKQKLRRSYKTDYEDMVPYKLFHYVNEISSYFWMLRVYNSLILFEENTPEQSNFQKLLEWQKLFDSIPVVFYGYRGLLSDWLQITVPLFVIMPFSLIQSQQTMPNDASLVLGASIEHAWK